MNKWLIYLFPLIFSSAIAQESLLDNADFEEQRREIIQAFCGNRGQLDSYVETIDEDATSTFFHKYYFDASGVKLIRAMWNGGGSGIPPTLTDMYFDDKNIVLYEEYESSDKWSGVEQMENDSTLKQLESVLLHNDKLIGYKLGEHVIQVKGEDAIWVLSPVLSGSSALLGEFDRQRLETSSSDLTKEP